MAVIYRAMWQDDRGGLEHLVHSAFAAWVESKHPGLEIQAGIDESISSRDGRTVMVSALRAEGGSGEIAVELVLREDSVSERWTTTARVSVGGSEEQWVWVDVDRTTTNPWSSRPLVAAPRLVRNPIDDASRGGGDPRWGAIRLDAKAVAIPPERVIDQAVNRLKSLHRLSPEIIFAHSPPELQKRQMSPALQYSSCHPRNRELQMTYDELSELPAISFKTVRPSPNIIEVFRNAGYKLPAAIADLVDNSIDAKAENILVRFVRTNSTLQTLQVIDDGKGMTSEELEVAMQFGSEKERSEDEHGLYGVGLKSASLSSCDSLTVVSRTRSGVVGARWTPEGARDDWKMEILDPERCKQKLREINAPQVSWQRSGTLILWSEVRDFSKATTPKEVDRFLKLRFTELSLHLGLHYHRIIEKGATTIHLDSFNSELGQRGPTETVRPVDPFNHPRTGKPGYPKLFKITSPDKCDLNLKAHIWPKKSALPEYKLDHVAERQGLYFYRNDRLIHGGGWGGSREDAEPHLNLARVAIDVPKEWQSEIRVFFNKSGVTVPATFPESLRAATSIKGNINWNKYLQDAISVRRKKADGSHLKPITAPGKGVPYSVKQALHRSFTMRPTDEVVVSWGDLPETEFFRIDNVADSPEISLTINSRFREEILRGRPKTVSDAPLVRTLLYLLLEEQMGKQRLSAGDRERLTALNRALVAAAKEE